MIIEEWHRTPTVTLSRRERQVLELLARDGATNREIAKELFLTEGTIKQHVASAMDKLGANNRTHLALIVCRQEKV